MKYAGIGSRATPLEITQILSQLAKELEQLGFNCITGGALGADKAFIDGAPLTTILYLPWQGYNGYTSDTPEITDKHLKFAEKYHPAWHKCGEGAKKMHARNCQIVLGDRLNDPVDFILCWTPNGEVSGGTAQALRIAIDYDIPVFNLGSKSGHVEIIKQFKKFVHEIVYKDNVM